MGRRRAAARVWGATAIKAGHAAPVRSPKGKFSGARPCKRALARAAAAADTWKSVLEVAILEALKFWPPYADYAKKTDREIPVVVLDPVG